MVIGSRTLVLMLFLSPLLVDTALRVTDGFHLRHGIKHPVAPRSVSFGISDQTAESIAILRALRGRTRPARIVTRETLPPDRNTRRRAFRIVVELNAQAGQPAERREYVLDAVTGSVLRERSAS